MRGETTIKEIERLMIELGRRVTSPGKVYFSEGASAVLMGWRERTLIVQLKPDPEPAGFFEALAHAKLLVNINIEVAAPSDSVPALPGWRERNEFIAKHGRIEFLH